MKREFEGSVLLNPVPVVLVTSRNTEGKDNVFTVAWTGTICSKPPMLYISIRPERLSYEYIAESREFVINLPTAKLTRETDLCGVRSGRVMDKIEACGFTMQPCTHVNAAYIAECPVNIECRVKEIVKLGTHDMFIAEVVGSQVDEALIDEKGKIHLEKANLITYSHGEYFPVDNRALGSFGFSVIKKNTLKKRNRTK